MIGNALFLFAIAKRKGGEGWSKETNVYKWSLTDKMRIQMEPDRQDAYTSVSRHKDEELDVESTSEMCAPCLRYQDDIKTSPGQ